MYLQIYVKLCQIYVKFVSKIQHRGRFSYRKTTPDVEILTQILHKSYIVLHKFANAFVKFV